MTHRNVACVETKIVDTRSVVAIVAAFFLNSPLHGQSSSHLYYD